MNPKRRAGNQIGPWTFVSRLGTGGNCEVWTAENGNVSAAVKILKGNIQREKSQNRFKAEIELHHSLKGKQGILPYIDSGVPENPTFDSPAWLATEIATCRLDKSRHLLKSLEQIVGAFVSFSTTLSRLASEGIHHRDIKPSNLFLCGDDWCIGDFGLATYPSKPEHTTNQNKLGPMYFIAPEMLNSPKGEAPGPADVYSLAKTFWVVTTGQRFPMPGHLSLLVDAFSIANFLNHPRAKSLDFLLSKCTEPIPSRRPSMPELCEELEKWLSVADNRVTKSGVLDLKPGLNQAMARHESSIALNKKRYDRLHKTIREFQEFMVGSIAQQIEQEIQFKAEPSYSIRPMWLGQILPSDWYADLINRETDFSAHLSIIPKVDGRELPVRLTLLLQFYFGAEDTVAKVMCVYYVDQRSPQLTWHTEFLRSFDPISPSGDVVVKECSEWINEKLPEALRQFVKTLEGSAPQLS